ncbi:type VII secretion system-associated protein [Streptomyces mayonensis]|uniref:type VII secretion system-associated protein n=1 Tax=Streptomyces mayonensis TaxID=2750816 RepID=UPI001C1DEFB8|nr:type VII secretion system-associated protein [Streptomyces sp. A108]MBU6533104.1 type VII secretion system-associated protein [Streptomyces sp. A108]
MAGVVLDSEFLKNFISEHIETFKAGLENILKDEPNGAVAISTLVHDVAAETLDVSKPLNLGRMTNGEDAIEEASQLNSAVQQGAEALQHILESHVTLFEDLEQALWDTIEKLAEAQGKNLESITPEEFSDLFEDVDSSSTNPGASSGGQGSGQGQEG